MNRLIPIFVGAIAILAFATLMLVVIPGAQIRDQAPALGLADYTPQQLAGRQQYINQGCVYCHSQQPRAVGQTLADLSKGWGRAPTAADFAYDRPHQLGTIEWSVSDKSDRRGVRLVGGSVQRHPDFVDVELPSEGMVRGAIQVPPNGEPVIFLNDHPVTGGYPVIGVVRTPDVDRVAQLTPGQSVRLRWEGRR